MIGLDLAGKSNSENFGTLAICRREIVGGGGGDDALVARVYPMT